MQMLIYVYIINKILFFIWLDATMVIWSDLCTLVVFSPTVIDMSNYFYET